MKLPKITFRTALASPRMATWASAVAILGAGAVLASSPAAAATSTADLTTQTAAAVAQSLVGPGVTISNVSYIGAPRAAGTFTGGASSVGLASGVILSTGDIADSVGPNTDDGVGTDLLQPGDADLSALSVFPTHDATILKFDFVPDGDRVSFRYVFGSEEYNEYVTSATKPSPYNDVFAFFINDVNCATVPGPAGPLPVSINTVNNGNPFGSAPNSNPALYRNNSRTDPGPATIDTELDGLTVVLTCSATVKPHEKNTLRLAIADASDAVWDSVVFIERGSLSTQVPDLTVRKELKPGQPTPKAGGNLYYLVRVKNVGTKATPATPANVTLLDTPPTGTSITSWSILTGNGRCSLDGNGRLSCDLGAGMAPEAETVVEVVIRTPKAGTLTNTAEVDPFNRITELDETNNRTTLVTVIP